MSAATSASDAELTDGFGAALDDGARAVALDFSAMEYMNSGGIGLLVTLLVRAQRAGVRDYYEEYSISVGEVDRASAWRRPAADGPAQD